MNQAFTVIAVHTVKERLGPGVETVLLFTAHQDLGGEHGGECKSRKGRYHHGTRNHECKLTEQTSCLTLHEYNRHKYAEQGDGC